MIEPLAVTVHAVKRAGDVTGQKICVLGAGPIGILLAQSAKALGAAETMITDVSDYRLELAKKCGVDHAVNTKTQDFGEALVAAFRKRIATIDFKAASDDVRPFLKDTSCLDIWSQEYFNSLVDMIKVE